MNPEKIYQITKEMFPTNSEHKYRNQDWIFPHHIDIVIEISKELCKKYGGDEEICTIASILHDIGLTSQDSPKGHEERSIEMAIETLSKENYSEENIDKIIGCIKTTDPDHLPKTINEKIVRSADALSKFKSIHYIAKANFSKDFNWYVNWLKKKIKDDENKIMFEEEKEEIKPIIEIFNSMIEKYEKNKINKKN